MSQSRASSHQALQLYEFPRYAIWPTDFILKFIFNENLELRKRRTEMLRKSAFGDQESRFQLGREVFLHAKNTSSNWEKRAYYSLAKRLFYRVIRNPEMRPGRLPIQSSTFYGSICYLQGDESAAIHHWSFAADHNETTAMYELGRLYKKKGDRGQAFHWIQLAAGLNHLKAQKMLDAMNSAPRPDYNLDPRAAELHIEEWMAHWGFRDAKATPVGPDGGFDVKSSRAAAQVKFRGRPTPLDQINSFHGACRGRYEYEIFVSKSGFTKPARDAADECEMALFTLESDGTPTPVNLYARRIFRD